MIYRRPLALFNLIIASREATENRDIYARVLRERNRSVDEEKFSLFRTAEARRAYMAGS